MVDNFSKDIVETFIKNDSVIQKYKDSFTTDPDQFVKRVKENPDSDTYLLIQDPITEMWGTISTGKDKKQIYYLSPTGSTWQEESNRIFQWSKEQGITGRILSDWGNFRVNNNNSRTYSLLWCMGLFSTAAES